MRRVAISNNYAFWQSPTGEFWHPRATLLHKVLQKHQACDWVEKVDPVMLSISNQNVVKRTTVEKAGNYFGHAVFICFLAFLPLQPKPVGMQAYKSLITMCLQPNLTLTTKNF